jgi:hypothetical protein
MTIFVVLTTHPNAALATRIRSAYPNDHYVLSESQWLISTSGTTIDLSNKLGVVDPNNPSATIGNAVIFATSSYYGRAPQPVWDWLKAKLEGR